MRHLRQLTINFDLDISDNELKNYYDDLNDDRGTGYLKEVLREELAKLHEDFWVKEIILKEASRGLYKLEVYFFAEMPDEDSPKVSKEDIRKKLFEIIADKDHAVMDVKIELYE